MSKKRADLSDMRKEYKNHTLEISDVEKDPIAQFAHWFDEAVKTMGIEEANAMTLSTCDPDGKPSGRIVLLKGFDEQGFIFYTNYDSRKGKELSENPWAGLTFFWGPLERQIRVVGKVTKVTHEESDSYFESRPIGSRRTAFVSPQSQPITTKDDLLKEIETVKKKFGDQIPRPQSWGGYKVVPYEIEFWQGRPNRFHDRIFYERTSDHDWVIKRLAP